MGTPKILSTVTKTFLKNVINHTDSHNKVVEESDMWNQRNKERKGGGDKDKDHSRPIPSTTHSFLKDRGVDMQFEYPSNSNRRAHMDEEPKGTYWMNELYKAEEADDNRWSHNGFKEMYPEKFDPAKARSCNSCSTKRKHSSRKDEKSESRKHSKRKSSQHHRDEQRSDRSSSQSDHSHRRHRKHKRRRTSSGSSDSDMDHIRKDSTHTTHSDTISRGSDTNYKRDRKRKQVRRKPSSSSSSDSLHSKSGEVPKGANGFHDNESSGSEIERSKKSKKEKKHKKQQNSEIETVKSKTHKNKKKKKKEKRKAKYET